MTVWSRLFQVIWRINFVFIIKFHMFNNKPSQPAFTELHLTIETLEQSMKYIQSYRYFVIVNFELVLHLVLLFLLLIFSTVFIERDQTYTLKQYIVNHRRT